MNPLTRRHLIQLSRAELVEIAQRLEIPDAELLSFSQLLHRLEKHEGKALSETEPQPVRRGRPRKDD
jgi:hypothetical protein